LTRPAASPEEVAKVIAIASSRSSLREKLLIAPSLMDSPNSSSINKVSRSMPMAWA
jgi:hypothetical protein